MAQALDIKYINPFLQATLTILETLGMAGGKVGKPSLADLDFPDELYLLSRDHHQNQKAAEGSDLKHENNQKL